MSDDFFCFASAASGSARRTGHVIALVLTSIMMVVFVAFTTHTTRTRRQHIEPTWRRCGPLFLACIAAVLIVLDPMRHVLMDNTGGKFGDGINLQWLLVCFFVVFLFIFENNQSLTA